MRPPKPWETILVTKDFKPTNYKVLGAKVYKRGKRYYHIDTFHRGKGAHLEVYDSQGLHLGEADILTGEIIPNTIDKRKKIGL